MYFFYTLASYGAKPLNARSSLLYRLIPSLIIIVTIVIEFGHSLVSTRVRLSVYNTVHSHVCLNIQNKRLLDKFNTKTDICWQV